MKKLFFAFLLLAVLFCSAHAQKIDRSDSCHVRVVKVVDGEDFNELLKEKGFNVPRK